MAERRGVAAAAATVTLLLALLCVSPTHPHPALHPPPLGQPFLTTTASSRRGGGGGWSLKDTLLRLDDLLQRHNDYNDVMLESGEEDDQLSRLLYRLQHGDRVREGWYDTEPTLPVTPDQRLDATTHTHKGRREHRLESTGLTRPATRALTHKEKKAKKSKGKRGLGKRRR